MDFAYILAAIAFFIQCSETRYLGNSNGPLTGLVLAQDQVQNPKTNASEGKDSDSIFPSSYDECFKMSTTLQEAFNLSWSFSTWGFDTSQKVGNDFSAIFDCTGLFSSAGCIRDKLTILKADVAQMKPTLAKYKNETIQLFADLKKEFSACF